jgi:hypothetical protein
MDIDVPDIDDPSPANGLPGFTEPILRNVNLHQQMKMCHPRLLKLKSGYETDGFPKLPPKNNTHLSPTISQIAVGSLTWRHPLWIEGQSYESLEPVLMCEFGNPRTNEFGS